MMQRADFKETAMTEEVLGEKIKDFKSKTRALVTTRTIDTRASNTDTDSH